jgi:hypothetical protein
LPVRKAYLVYINNQYVRNGALDLDQLFLFEDLTGMATEKEGWVREEIGRLRGILDGGVPVTDIGEHCSDPYSCDFQGHCWAHIPEYSVLDLVKRGVKPWDLYRQGFLRLRISRKTAFLRFNYCKWRLTLTRRSSSTPKA